MQKPYIYHRQASKRGFTIIELMVALTILTLLTIFSTRIYLNYTATSRDLKAANLVYDEARFLMDKIVREVRQNAIDYEQYFNQNINRVMDPATTYTNNYCSYSSFFYDSGKDKDPETFKDNESRGLRNPELLDKIVNTYNLAPAAVNPLENELYLISMDGTRRTVMTRIKKEVEGEKIGKLGLLKMIGKDFGDDHINGIDSYNGLLSTNIDCAPDDRENDGLIDSWLCDPDFPCKKDQTIVSTSNPSCEGYTDSVTKDDFVDISPNAINIVSLHFLIAPQDDPWKAYSMNEVQIQPHVTIQLTVAANPKLVPLTNTTHIPSITLTSTISSRNYGEIKSDCK